MKDHVWITSRGKRLSAMLHHPEGKINPPLIIFCHGFTGEKVGGSQFYLQLANSVEASGFAVVRFEYAGSGESEGEFAVDTTVTGWKTDLANVVGWVKQQPAYQDSLLFILGHSLGGCIALLHDDQSNQVTGRIALAPEILPEENYRQTILGPERWAESEEGKTISHFFGKSYSLEPYFVRDLLKQKHAPLQACKSYDCPVLLIHGTEDNAVPVEVSRMFYEQYQGPKELHVLEGADHGFSRHISELKVILLKWLTKNFPVRNQSNEGGG